LSNGGNLLSDNPLNLNSTAEVKIADADNNEEGKIEEEVQNEG